MSAIRVSWLPDFCKERDIKIYFSKNEHGGGPVQCIYYPMFNGDAVVMFTDPDTADTVVSIEEHVISDSSVGVTKLPALEVFPKLEAKLDPSVADLLQADDNFRSEIEFNFYNDNVEFIRNEDGNIKGIRGNWYLLEWTWAHIDNFIKKQSGAKFDRSSMRVDPLKSTRRLQVSMSQRKAQGVGRQTDDPLISLPSTKSGRSSPTEVVKQMKAAARLNDDDEKYKHDDDDKIGDNDDESYDDDNYDDDNSGDNHHDVDDDKTGFRAVADARTSTVKRMPSNAQIVIKSAKGDVYKLEFTYGHINVSVFVGLITLAKTDAIVNAVNGSLTHVGGLAYAISQAASPNMKKECDVYIAKRGILGDGEVMHTSAGGKLNDKVKYIMHTVGPKWYSAGETRCCADLLRAFLNCLKYANDHLKINSITFPLISSGVFGMPIEMCAKSFLYALVLFQHECDAPCLQKVDLVNKDTSSTASTVVQLQHLIPQGPETLIADAKLLQESVSVPYRTYLRSADDDYPSLPLGRGQDLRRDTRLTTRQDNSESSITHVRGQKLLNESSSGAMDMDKNRSFTTKRTSPPKTSYAYEKYGATGYGTSLSSTIFHDHENRRRILVAISPAEQKRIGRQVRGFQDSMWGRICKSVVKRGTFLKFRQNDALRKQLISSHPKQLVEANPFDRKWGIGLCLRDPRIHDSKNWRGDNLLGEILMEVREEIMPN